MWREEYELYKNKLCALHIKIGKSEHTPILFDDYNENSYYYMLNNNKNYIYSVDELYELLKKSKIDPFTQLPIDSYRFVKISFI